MSSKRPSSKSSSPRLDMEDRLLITQHAAECVEELMVAIRENTGTPWFLIMERKMKKLAERIKEREQGK